MVFDHFPEHIPDPETPPNQPAAESSPEDIDNIELMLQPNDYQCPDDQGADNRINLTGRHSEPEDQTTSDCRQLDFISKVVASIEEGEPTSERTPEDSDITESAGQPRENRNEGGDGGDGGDQIERDQSPEEPLKFRDLYPTGPEAARGEVSIALKYVTAVNGIENLQRAPVPRTRGPWDVDYPSYDPPFVDKPVGKPPISGESIDLDPDDPREVTREMISWETGQPVDKDEDGRPLNVMGRTGIAGRGVYNRWGPSKSVIDIITRNNPYTLELEVLVTRSVAPYTEFLHGNDTLPEMLMVDDEEPSQTLASLRSIRDLGDFMDSEDSRVFFLGPAPRKNATDHSWSETLAVHTHLSEEAAGEAPDSFGDDGRWAPVNSLLYYHNVENIFMDPHNARLLEVIAEQAFERACLPEHPEGVVEKVGYGKYIERYNEQTPKTVHLADGQAVTLPFTLSWERTIAKYPGRPAPDITYRYQLLTQFETLPADAKKAVEIAEAIEEEGLLDRVSYPNYKQLVSYLDENFKNHLYTVPHTDEADRDTLRSNRPGAPLDPKHYGKKVKTISPIGSGYVAVPSRSQLPERAQHRDKEINFFGPSNRNANAFWVSGNPIGVSSEIHPQLLDQLPGNEEVPRFVIFPIVFYNITTED